MGMRAVTRPLDREVDLNGFARGDGFLFVRDGIGVAGRGVAARVPVAEVASVLPGIECDDAVGRPGCGPECTKRWKPRRQPVPVRETVGEPGPVGRGAGAG